LLRGEYPETKFAIGSAVTVKVDYADSAKLKYSVILTIALFGCLTSV